MNNKNSNPAASDRLSESTAFPKAIPKAIPNMNARTLDPAHHLIETEPYYEAVGEEIHLFESAYRQQIPVLLKGPTGCGKTRFMEHMAWRLKRPLITVSCHDDLTASDLVGRYLVKGGETVWVARLPAPYAAAVSAIWMKSSKPERTPWW